MSTIAGERRATDERSGPPRWALPLVRQFGRPRGLLGRVAALMMARRNGPKNRWVVEVMGVGAGDALLDVGCGLGWAVAEAAERVGREGMAAGVDHSAVMVSKARARNRSTVRAGTTEVRLGAAEALPFEDARFTHAVAVNSMGFWTDREAALAEMFRVLRPGGRAGIAMRRLDVDARPGDPARWGADDDAVQGVVALFRQVGFVDVDVVEGEPPGERMALVVGRRP